jgi:hypothetical protein
LDDLLIILTDLTRPGGAVQSDAPVIIVEVGSELIDYEIDENGLKEISRMTIGPEDHVSRLTKAKMATDRGEPIDVGNTV